jgi:glycosyltransferase involved in cell wall biosynthesis
MATKSMPAISIVSPVYKAEASLEELYQRLVLSLETITPDFEIIFVEDCGGDRSWDIIQELSRRDKRVKGIQFSRNFGQHHAITAGFDHATGDWGVLMDCDLQDQPEDIPKLYNKAMEGYDIVLGVRQKRKHRWFNILAARCFYRFLEYATGAAWDSRIGSFRIMSRKVIQNFGVMREQSRYFGGMIQWLGFKTALQDVVHAPRKVGKSTYAFRKLFGLALNAVLSFSERPLYASVFAGFAISTGAFVCGLYFAGRKIFYDVPIAGWASLIVSMYFLSGLILLNLGIMGLYVGKVFQQTKNRPLYVVSNTAGL